MASSETSTILVARKSTLSSPGVDNKSPRGQRTATPSGLIGLAKPASPPAGPSAPLEHVTRTRIQELSRDDTQITIVLTWDLLDLLQIASLRPELHRRSSASAVFELSCDLSFGAAS